MQNIHAVVVLFESRLILIFLDHGNRWTFKVGYTAAMDHPIEKITGMKPPKKWLENAKIQNKVARQLVEEGPKRVFLENCATDVDKFDWTDHDGVTPVQDQGYCGSCWVFTTHAAFEGSYAILNKDLTIDSAEQDTLDNSGQAYIPQMYTDVELICRFALLFHQIRF